MFKYKIGNMKYSKILLGAFIFFGLGVFSSCDVNEEFYDELDAAKDGTENAQTFDVDLTTEDYSAISKLALKTAKNNADTVKAEAVASLLSFSDSRPAADYIPAFLTSKYKNFDVASAANVTFSYDTRDLEYLLAYTDGEYFKLGSEEYETVSELTGKAGYFSPSYTANEYLPSILLAKYTEAKKEDVVLVSYDSRDTDVIEVSQVSYFSADFSENLDQFELRSEAGDGQVWKKSVRDGIDMAKMSGYDYDSSSRLDNNDWLITPEVDLSDVPDAVLNFSQAQKYLSGDWQQTFVYVTDDYSKGDDIDVAKWTELSVNNKPTGDSYTYFDSGDIDLSAYSGKKIHLAFVYKSNTVDASTWQISKIDVLAKGQVKGDETKMYYTFDGTVWSIPSGVYNLQSSDYDSMGTAKGQPGERNNFSSSIEPENYLSTFLANKYIYAQEADVVVAVYKYWDGKKLNTIAAEYTYTDGVWATMPTKSEQYVFSSIGWVFDPTISFSMGKEDYDIIVKYSIAQHGSTSKYETSEYYYGSSSNFDNFDLRFKNRRNPVYPIEGFDGLSDEETVALMDDRMLEGVAIMLAGKYPEAVDQVNGIDVFYNVTVITFEEGYIDGEYTFKFQCTKSGPSPEFTYIEGLPERD